VEVKIENINVTLLHFRNAVTHF